MMPPAHGRRRCCRTPAGWMMDLEKILIFRQKNTRLEKILSLKSDSDEVNNVDVCQSTLLRRPPPMIAAEVFEPIDHESVVDVVVGAGLVGRVPIVTFLPEEMSTNSWAVIVGTHSPLSQ